MLGSTPSDAAQGLYSLYTLGYKSFRDRRKKKKKKARMRRRLAEAKRVRVENLLGQWNKSHSPLASKRYCAGSHFSRKGFSSEFKRKKSGD